MFSFFRGKSMAAPTDAQSPKEPVIPDVDSDDEKGSFDTEVQVSGGKGWPSNVTVLLYHKRQGLICVGTEGGAIYVYGDGFQYMRPWLTDEANEVVSIVPLHPNRIIVAFGDNSLVVMELPTLEVIDLLQPNWMNPRWGDITAIHSDPPSEKNFVYIGTSDGFLTVLDVMESSIRICDFELNLTDFGLQGQSFCISDIQSCPKDERFLAIGFDGTTKSSGAVVVYDLVKHKIHKQFKTASVSSLQWHHLGEILFAGTRAGEVLVINPDKGICAAAWNAQEEKIDDEDEEDSQVFIRRISWLAPQTEGTEGCLFVLIATTSPDNDNLKNVIIGLHPGVNTTELNLIFALPPIPNEKIISFRVVPTYNKAAKAKEGATCEDVEKTPGLLLLVQRQVDISLGKVERYLYNIRCPTVEISDWGLEIGTLPDPRKAKEVQPAAAEITSTTGFVPNFQNPLSLGKALLTGAVEEDSVVSTASLQKAPAAPLDEFAVPDPAHSRRMSRRLSTRQFYESHLNVSDLEVQLQQSDDWEISLVNGEHEENTEGILRQQDIVLNGHADGTIIVYGVSMPDARKELGKASVWLPVTALRCGTTSVTSMSYDESAGLLLAGDEQGFLVLFEIYDTKTKTGATDILRRIYEHNVSEAETLAQDSKNISEFSPNQYLLDCQIYDYLSFNSIREVYRTKLVNESISLVYLLGSFFLSFIGTQDGNIYVSSNDLKSPVYAKIDKIDSTGAKGAVKGFDHGYYLWNGNLIVVVYAFFESGHVLMIDISNMTVISYSVALNASKFVEGKERTIYPINSLPVLNVAFNTIAKPTLLSFLYGQARIKNSQRNVFASSGSFDSVDSTNTAGVTRPQSTLLQTQSHQQNSEQSSDALTAASQQQLAPKKRSFFSSFSRAPSNVTTPPPPPPNSATTTPPPPPPLTSQQSNSSLLSDVDVNLSSNNKPNKFYEYTELQVPKYLMFISGNSLTTIALSKAVALSQKMSPQVTASLLQSVQTKEICKKGELIISSQLIHLKDPNADPDDNDHEGNQNTSDDHPSSPNSPVVTSNGISTVPYFVCVDNQGWLRIISLKSRAPVHHANVLEGVVSFENDGPMKDTDGDDEENDSNHQDNHSRNQLYSGIVLNNGSCYLLQRGTMQYSSTLIFIDEEKNILPLFPSPVPEPAIPTSHDLDKKLTLLHGREQLLMNLKNQIKKRRSSVINLSAAPTDLFKIFQKTREQRAREELFEGTSNPSNEDNNPSNKTKSNVNKVMNEMNELKQNFVERGEKINRIALKMDDFKLSAQNYKQAAKEQKELLQKRNARWGLF